MKDYDVIKYQQTGSDHDLETSPFRPFSKSSFVYRRERILEGKAREGSWSGPMTAEQRCHREILSGI